VADDRVERVRGPVGGRARDAEECRPQQRRDNRVARVLGHGLDCGPAELGRVELGRIATDQRGSERTCLLDLTGFDGCCERECGPLQRAATKRHPHKHCPKHDAGPCSRSERAVDPGHTGRHSGDK